MPSAKQSNNHAQVMILAILAVASLLFVTWAMGRVSRWIVSHDEVWGRMDKEGKKIEHALAEAFVQVGGDGRLLIVETVIALVFLWLLWRERPRCARHRDSSSE